jgi:hypothetical protein
MKILVIILLLLAALITTLIHGQSYSTLTYEAGSTIEIQTGADVCADQIIVWHILGGTICQGPLPVTLSFFGFGYKE